MCTEAAVAAEEARLIVAARAEVAARPCLADRVELRAEAAGPALVATAQAAARVNTAARAGVAAAGGTETPSQMPDARQAGRSAADSASVLRLGCVRRAPRGERRVRAAGWEGETRPKDRLAGLLAREEPVFREPADRKVDTLAGPVAKQAAVVISAASAARLVWGAGAAQPKPAESPGAEERWLATPVPRIPART